MYYDLKEGFKYRQVWGKADNNISLYWKEALDGHHSLNFSEVIQRQ